jgi:uncharacterized protein (TIRG00374 family)
VSKRIIWDVFKYVLAGGLLAYVVWSNWGQPNPIASKIVVDPKVAKPNDTDAPTLTGTVTDYVPGESITVAPPDGKPIQLGLVKDKWKLLKLSFVQIDAEIQSPSDAGPIGPGTVVAVWEHPRGLAYVWQRHVIEREPVHLWFLALGAVLGLTAITLTFIRWYVLVRAQDLPFTIPDALRLGFIGFFFNSVMPGSVGGDIIKATFLAREKPDRKTIAVSTVIMDRLIALWALVWFVAISGGIFWALGLLQGPGADQSRFIVKVAAIIVAVSFTGWLLLGLLPAQWADRYANHLNGLPKVGHTLAEFWRAVWMYRCRQKSIAFTMLISWTGHIFFVLYFYCSARVLWDPGDPAQRIPSLAQHFLLVPIGLVIRAVPLFPGGVGIGEMGYGVLYKWLGASESSGVLGSLVNRVCDWTISIFGFFIYRHLRVAIPAKGNGEEPDASRLDESRFASIK